MYMEKKYNLKKSGFPPIIFCKNEPTNVNNKKERFFQDNIVHNINIKFAILFAVFSRNIRRSFSRRQASNFSLHV